MRNILNSQGAKSIGIGLTVAIMATHTWAEDSSHVPYEQRFKCEDKTLGAVTRKSANSFYTWVDENGVTHFSDARSKSSGAEQMTVQTGNQREYFQLDLTAHDISPTFKDTISSHVNKSFLFYKDLLGARDLKKIAVNMQVFGSQESYVAYQSEIGTSVNAYAPGFYSPSRNESVLLYRGDTLTSITAVHEAAHSITSGIVGYTSPWLTEGISEYLEQIRINMQIAEVYPNTSWYRNGYLHFTPTSLQALINASHSQFYGSNQSSYYGTAWAFVYFLMDDPTRKAQFADLLRFEMKERCDTAVTTGSFLTASGLNLNVLQREFTQWLNVKEFNRVHRY